MAVGSSHDRRARRNGRRRNATSSTRLTTGFLKTPRQKRSAEVMQGGAPDLRGARQAR